MWASRSDKALLRFALWTVFAVLFAALVAPNFPSLLSQALNSTFGTIFPAIPFASLLTVLFWMRWKDLRSLLEVEKGLSTEARTRAAGVGILVALYLLRGPLNTSVELACTSVILCFYGAALALYPLTWRLLLPYALIYIGGVTGPAILQWALGGVMASLSASAAAGLASLTGVAVYWQGTSFAFTSKTGDLISAVVTPGCSSMISITTFVGLLALMHLDMRKKPSLTVATAGLGILTLFVLNALRIVILIWAGYVEGSAFFWSLHNWVGYSLFVGFYVVVLVLYTGAGRTPSGVSPPDSAPGPL